MTQHTASGPGAPTSAPPSIGAHYTDTSSGDQYLAKGVLSPADWVLQGGAGGKKIVELPGGSTALALAHANVFLASDLGGEVVVPLRSAINFPVGTEIEIGQLSNDSVTVSVVEGVEIIQKKSTKLETNGRGTMIRLKQVSSDVWLATGDLVPETYLAGLTWGPSIAASLPLKAPIQAVPELGVYLSLGNTGVTSIAWSEDGELWALGGALPTTSRHPHRLVWSPQRGELIAAVPVNAAGEIDPVTGTMAGVNLLSSPDGKSWSLSQLLTTTAEFLGNGTEIFTRTALNPVTGQGQVLCRLGQSGAEGSEVPTTFSMITTDGGGTWAESVETLVNAGESPAPLAFTLWSDVAQAFVGFDYSGNWLVSTVLGRWEVKGPTGATYQGGNWYAEDPATGIILACLGGGDVLRSTDAGQTWETVPVAPEGSYWRLNNLHFGPLGFLAGDESTSKVHMSPDGLTWTSVGTPDNKYLSVQTKLDGKGVLGIYAESTNSELHIGKPILLPVE